MSGDGVVLTLLVFGLPAYNFAANRWPPFNKALFVPMNLGLLAVVLALGLGPLDLGSRDITGRVEDHSLPLGILLGIVVALPLFAALAWPRAARLVADERVAHLSGNELAYQVLIRIPLGTALVEEVAFRGVLLAALRPSGTIEAAVASSVVFGLWHVGPTINLVQANRPGSSTTTLIIGIACAVALTTAAGLIFVWLRLEVGLLGPVAMHAVINSLATLAAVSAHDRIHV